MNKNEIYIGKAIFKYSTAKHDGDRISFIIPNCYWNQLNHLVKYPLVSGVETYYITNKEDIFYQHGHTVSSLNNWEEKLHYWRTKCSGFYVYEKTETYRPLSGHFKITMRYTKDHRKLVDEAMLREFKIKLLLQ